MSKGHDLIADFIEIYRSFPCLWKKTDRQYHSTVKRENAYKILLEKHNEYDPNAGNIELLMLVSCVYMIGVTDFCSSRYVSSRILKYVV
jgi:hypothetical protein